MNLKNKQQQARPEQSLLKLRALPQGRVLARGALFCLVHLHSPRKAVLLFKAPCEENHCCSREKEAGIIFSCQLTALSKGNPGSSESRARDPSQAPAPEEPELEGEIKALWPANCWAKASE